MGTKHEAIHLLVVDDEPDIREILQFNLESEGYHIDTAGSAAEALQRLTARHRLLLLDVMLGDMSGFQLADHLRRQGNQTPIIFLTAKDTENDMLTGFSIGGDDYIAKPFSIKEVLARVKSVLKRSSLHTEAETEASECICSGGIVLNTRAKTITVDQAPVALTRTEYNILLLLLTHAGVSFSRADILDKAWANEGLVLERTVDVHIARLRKKITPYGHCIINRTGYGYTFNPPQR